MTRRFAVLMVLALLRGPEVSAQSVEAGPVFGDLGRGVRISTQISQDWRLNLHGTYRAATLETDRRFGGLVIGVNERVTYGTVGVTARRTLSRGWALDVGAWVLMARRALAVSAESSSLLDADLDSQELGALSGESRLTQTPTPYLGLSRSSQLGDRLRLSLDAGVLSPIQSQRGERAEGRLAETTLWGNRSGSPFLPVVQFGLQYLLHAPNR